VAIVGDRYIAAKTLSEGWLEAVRLLHEIDGGKVVHLVVRIGRPDQEIPEIRGEAQALIDEWNAGHANEMPDIETTSNTLFPASFARRTDGPEELVAYYRERYTKAGLRGFKDNERGTYFGRIVAYPRGEGQEPADQLSDTVRKLRQELDHDKGSHKSSRYEINIYSEACDTIPMSFPCLAHLSVHLHQGEVHLQAVYRNESLIARGYGNFLGLAELQAYIAEHAGAAVGELMITAGHAELDGLKRPVGRLLSKFPAP
jgi:thymidylate synthase